MNCTLLSAGKDLLPRRAILLGGIALWVNMVAPGAAADPKPTVGETRIARWKDDRTAAFLLMFDDSWPSHFQVAAPELAKRDMVATFYICPAKGEYVKFAKEWEEKLWKQGMVYGNHTMTHKGVKDLENAEYEIGECANVIRKIVPGKEDRLVSYAQPGVGPDAWNITADQLNELLAKHHMISRGTFAGHGAVYHMQTTEQMLALADKAIAAKGLEYLVIHGVERLTPDWKYQDFWALKQDIFLPLLDALKERRDKGDLWITDHISAHQYEKERESAEVRVLEARDRTIRLQLKCAADPKYYDVPLTLITQVPADWKRVSVKQGEKAAVVDATNSSVRFDAVPGPDEIRLTAE
jgi:peptidoglycan/xylan/chitin deacetylase (PgdA/CDA1 family)